MGRSLHSARARREALRHPCDRLATKRNLLRAMHPLVRPVAALAAFAWLAVTLLLTLFPGSQTPPLTFGTFFCVACTDKGVADLILNWILFIPGGALLAILIGLRPAVLACAAITLGVEVLQISTPGRDPTFQDLVFNSLGGWTGARLMVGPWPKRLDFAGAAIGAAVWLAPVVLLLPFVTGTIMYGLWTPRMGAQEHYTGTVTRSVVGGDEVFSMRIPDEIDIRGALLERKPIEVSLEVGAPTGAFSPVFMLSSRRRTEHLTIAVVGEDVVIRGMNVARRLRLDQPYSHAPGAFSGLAPGRRVELELDRARRSGCFFVDRTETCGIAPSLGDGWAFLRNPSGASLSGRARVSFFWALTIGLWIGFALGGTRGWLAGAGTSLVGLLMAFLSPDVRPDLVHAGLLALSAGAGALLRPHGLRFRRFVTAGQGKE